jgi:hypothetical protein
MIDPDSEDRSDAGPPSSRQRSPSLAITLGIGSGLLVLLLCIEVVLTVYLRQPAAQPPGRSARDVTVERYVASPSAIELGFLGIFWGFVCLVSVFYAALVILLLVWFVRDARARAVDSEPLWIMAILFSGPVGFLIYLASRPQGPLIVCFRCGNRRLMAAHACHFCGLVVD